MSGDDELERDHAELPHHVEIEANPAGGWRVVTWFATNDSTSCGYTTAHESLPNAIGQLVTLAATIPDGREAYKTPYGRGGVEDDEAGLIERMT